MFLFELLVHDLCGFVAFDCTNDDCIDDNCNFSFDSCNFSFAGLKTHTLRNIEATRLDMASDDLETVQFKRNIAAQLQQALFHHISVRTQRFALLFIQVHEFSSIYHL